MEEGALLTSLEKRKGRKESVSTGNKNLPRCKKELGEAPVCERGDLEEKESCGVYKIKEKLG